MGVGARPSGVEMGRTLGAVAGHIVVWATFLLAIGFLSPVTAQIVVEGALEGTGTSPAVPDNPMILDADHLDFKRDTESYEAQGNVVFVQSGSRLTNTTLSSPIPARISR